MVIFTNKYCELLPIEPERDKIEILRNFNNIAFEVKINDKKMKKINFKTDKFKDDEYPIMLVLPNEYKRYMFVGADEKRMEIRFDIISGHLLVDEKKYPIKREYVKVWFGVLWNNILLYFRKLWWCGVLNRRNIYKEKFTIQKDCTDFFNRYTIMRSANDTIDLMGKFMKRYEGIKETKSKTLKWTREIIEYANTISVRNMK